MWSHQSMAQKLSWERRKFDSRAKTNIRDEQAFRETDVAARWLAQAEERQKPQGKSPAAERFRLKQSAQQVSESGLSEPERERLKHCRAQRGRPPWD
jgi:hypothetical protein